MASALRSSHAQGGCSLRREGEATMADPTHLESSDWHIVEAADELDMATAPELRHSLLQGINDGYYRVVLDLTRVTFIDSSGFAVLVSALKRLRASGGDLRLAGAGRAPLSAMRISGLDQIFAMYPDASAAASDPELGLDVETGRQP
jgi:anti-sigma B factor antagonist